MNILDRFIRFNIQEAILMTIADQKITLRKEMLFKRAKLNKQQKATYDQWICNSIWQLIHQHHFQTIHCYLPMGTEIDLTPLIENMLSQSLTVVCPKTFPKRKLQNLVLASLDKLEKGVFGTSHPANANEYTGSYDLIIVPGLAFDANRFRLGYGGGYYDNFLVHQPTAHKLGIFYPFQEVEQVPIEPHDIQLDDILVEQETFDVK